SLIAFGTWISPFGRNDKKGRYSKLSFHVVRGFSRALFVKTDSLVKIQFRPFFVIPAKAGIQ
ncbi:MAG TPA: hypothetical protein PK953_00395, partial [Smithellaceae bacterium]|nr:hypothetical protein [Syntrophaceae bacterium]HOD63870.1 hypothetical protein [Smithellaceae bacterium]HOE23610.1 hypothetical protein [Smithellaceae bacterium]HOU57202.1 hypothetical protein [Smithellaceae bacterium]HPY06100.1 hypothetical protein [Smithellaceae bacterium]